MLAGSLSDFRHRIEGVAGSLRDFRYGDRAGAQASAGG